MVPILSFSASGKGEQGRDVTCVGSLQGGDVVLPRFAGLDKTVAAPGEAWSPKPLDQEVGEHPCVAAVAVGEWVRSV